MEYVIQPYSSGQEILEYQGYNDLSHNPGLFTL